MNDQAMSQNSKDKSYLRLLMFFSVMIMLIIGLMGFSSYQKNQANAVNMQRNMALDKQQELLLSQEDVINTNWLHTLNPLVKDVQGRLLWSSQKQLGLTTFKSLPKVKDKQSYHLYVYDLGARNTDAFEVAVFKPSSTGQYESSFKPNVNITSPLKFELILREEGVAEGQPLLFAQP